jgi:hypothetical protein
LEDQDPEVVAVEVESTTKSRGEVEENLEELLSSSRKQRDEELDELEE